MITGKILPGEPLAPDVMDDILTRFHRDGYVLVPGVLTPDEVTALRETTDRLFADPALAGTKYIERDFILRNTLELDPIFVDMLIREPIVGLAEAILGKDCKFCGQNVIRNPKGVAITRWHVDDTVEFPLPDDVPRYDPRVRMPVQWFTIHMALSDIDSVENGPTQYVPGSHYSGRPPNSQEHPTFEGQGPVSMLCKTGDIYLHNNQCWHRGAPVTSERVRYLMDTQYTSRWAFTRFGEYNRVPIPESVLARKNERVYRVMGLESTDPHNIRTNRENISTGEE
ncbi:MAG: phytanoyl-CoA dioxygenase family protein [candidate division Zixibacteria bacterium]|nr:phytanoyl-CoA dioxygenase family protein [candidate division Zixibacteria bacterium]